MSRSRREMVRPTSRPADTSWRLTPIDRFASQWLIQGTWIFDRRIDVNALKHGLVRLLEAYPILCGRVVAGERIDWAESGIPVIEETDTALGVRDFGPTTVDVRRFGARYRPASIRYGLAPLLTVRLTHLRDGCVLALCGSHIRPQPPTLEMAIAVASGAVIKRRRRLRTPRIAAYRS